MERSVVARNAKRGVWLVFFALVLAYLYYRLRAGSHTAAGPIMWIPALICLVGGLYSTVFAPESTAIAHDRYRRSAWVRALNLGMEPNAQSIRWLGVAQAGMGVLLLASWAFELLG